MAAEKPDVFNAYQQTQSPHLERVMASMEGTGYVASFIGHEPAKALFVGLYSIGTSKRLTHKQYWQVPAYREMRALGMEGFKKDPSRPFILWFKLTPVAFYPSWKGKLTVGWPPPERSWWRRAHRNDIPVLAVLEDSAFEAAMPEWDELSISWDELRVLPKKWKAALSHWRGIYHIFDTAAGKGYVGSAGGAANLLGRWTGYAASGHGGNRFLKQRDPKHFSFSILQRVSPDLPKDDIVRLESSWKRRLHTRAPYGLNDN